MPAIPGSPMERWKAETEAHLKSRVPGSLSCVSIKKKKKQDILFKRLNIIDACKILSSDTIRRSDFIEVYVAFEELLHCKDEL